MAPDERSRTFNGGILSHSGQTRDGHPLAMNHFPGPELAPWFCWFAVSSAELPPGATVVDSMLNDLACVRLLYGGRWTAETRDGPQVFEPDDIGLALHFGPQSKAMRVKVEGSFKVVTIHLAAGASAVMGGPDMPGIVDRIFNHDELVGHGRLAGCVDPANPDPRHALECIEAQLRKFVELRGTRHPDPMVTDFELCALTNPTIEIAAFAARHKVTTRTVERAIGQAYGLSPKQVLRRARALDIAAVLMGVAVEEEEAELRLRYYDQSHLNREIRAFFDTTPSDLRSGAHPLLRLNTETRQARRLQALARMPEGILPPWRDPAAEQRP